jgi:hypothetical protein
MTPIELNVIVDNADPSGIIAIVHRVVQAGSRFDADRGAGVATSRNVAFR